MRSTSPSFLRHAIAASALAALGLAGCNDSPDDLVISGTAATGAPLANASVGATCASGTASSQSDGQGGFRIVVGGGRGPCLLTVSPGSGATLHSIAIGTSRDITANITPLTNLLTEYLRNIPISGVSAIPPTPEAWFQLPSSQSLLSVPTAVNTRIVNDFLPVVRALATQGGQTLNLSSADFLRTPFNPAAGNPLDDALGQLRTANVVSSTGAPTTNTSTTITTSAHDDAPVPPTTTGTGGG